MALQGTIETFALPDVMRLLASTKKTGCLRLNGSRGAGSVWVESGAIVASDASGATHATSPVDVFFELLRFHDGDFVFDADVVPEEKGAPVEVEPTLEEAERMLDEWRAIEAVVPSLSAWVELRTELPADEITIDRDRWRMLVAIGAGTSVGALGDRLELGELAISRAVKALVDAQLVTVGDAPAGVGTEPAFEAEPAFEVPEPVFETAAPPADGHELMEEAHLGESAPLEVVGNGSNGAGLYEPEVAVEESTLPPPPVTEPAAVGAPFEPDPSDAAEIARQLANLSPKAAKAVAAAAKATTLEEREAALAEVDDDEDPINRELLIKFLGSVNS